LLDVPNKIAFYYLQISPQVFIQTYNLLTRLKEEYAFIQPIVLIEIL
jgi:hypothetical protein